MLDYFLWIFTIKGMIVICYKGMIVAWYSATFDLILLMWRYVPILFLIFLLINFLLRINVFFTIFIITFFFLFEITFTRCMWFDLINLCVSWWFLFWVEWFIINRVMFFSIWWLFNVFGSDFWWFWLVGWLILMIRGMIVLNSAFTLLNKFFLLKLMPWYLTCMLVMILIV